MKTIVREAGERPVLATPARMNAPQGARALADLLSEEDYCDLCILTIDWEGDGFTPVLTVFAVKWYIKGGGVRLQVEWNIDIDDAFEQDNMDNGILRQIVYDLGEFIHQKEEERNRS